ncbi:flagellin lysine-N-methylase [Clostridium sp. CF012]|uniref:flagellin lysine-N-methylase n=1 Tax=Clostridium sp. CF012 TaxID=2843319 RepID=UPI001C0D02A1|nr:flagellin lysine-N-methylase [Clostridium sp. CF012]MBU3142337.1 flagellin lysine-N-methylase [Clostridium sp. CF012]
MKKHVLVPKYVRDFSCIGPKCEDDCCYGWQVFIDKKTYKKYKCIKDKSIKSIIDKSVTRNRKSSSEHNYGKIKMNESKVCPFQDENKLCSIHKTLGWEYLSYTCYTYPRVNNFVLGKYEKSALMSCPEIARLVLLNLNKMEFDEVEDVEKYNDVLWKQLGKGKFRELQQYFWDLRVFSIDLLQNRNFSIEKRLILLGLFLRKVNQYVLDKKTDAIPQLIISYNSEINENFKDLFDEVPTEYNIQLQMMKIISDTRVKFNLHDTTFKECLDEFYEGMGYNDTNENNTQNYIDNYIDNYNKYYEPYMKEHEYMLENYLVNYVFTNLFPVGSDYSVFDEYCLCILHYSLIKTYLIGISGFYKKLDEKLVVKLIFSMCRCFEHGNQVLEYVFAVFKSSNKMNMEYMALLIKN